MSCNVAQSLSIRLAYSCDAKDEEICGGRGR